MSTNESNANYATFKASPNQIEGAIHNTANARKGVAFRYRENEIVDAVEIAFCDEPHGNMRSVLVIDMEAAKRLRHQLDQILDGTNR